MTSADGPERDRDDAGAETGDHGVVDEEEAARIRAVAELAEVELPRRPPPAPRLGPTGQLIGNAMVGLHHALYGHRDEVTMIADANGDPDPNAELDLTDDPRQARITLHRRDDQPPSASD